VAAILSIEDEASLQQALGMALYNAGYEVHYAFNGAEGYDKILSLHPHLVLLDLMLPMLSGIEILKRVRARPEFKDLPIIVLTAMYDDESRLERDLRDWGRVEYMRKPFDVRELLERIRRALQSAPATAPRQPSVAKGAVRLDPKCRTLWIEDRLVATLSPKKARLVQLLLEAPGPVKRTRLLEKVWARASALNALEKTIQRLREDLGPREGLRLVTTNEGYELVG